jgi:hypothetical protein
MEPTLRKTYVNLKEKYIQSDQPALKPGGASDSP